MFGQRRKSSVSGTSVAVSTATTAASPTVDAPATAPPPPTAEEQGAAALKLQQISRGWSARQLRRQMTANLESQRSIAMDLLSSETGISTR